MRNSNKSRQLLSLARIFVLVLCFTLVFTAALVTFDNLDWSNDTSLAANEDDNEAKGGIVSVAADHGPLTAALFDVA